MNRRAVLKSALFAPLAVTLRPASAAAKDVIPDLTAALAKAVNPLFGRPVTTPVGATDLLVVTDTPVTIYVPAGQPVRIVTFKGGL